MFAVADTRLGREQQRLTGAGRKLDLNGRTLVFELEWNKLADRVVPQAREISRFPANRRDIAVVVAENVPAADIFAAFLLSVKEHYTRLLPDYPRFEIAESFFNSVYCRLFDHRSLTPERLFIFSSQPERRFRTIPRPTNLTAGKNPRRRQSLGGKTGSDGAADLR